MDLPGVFHALIDAVPWSSKDNADEAHAAVDANLPPQKASAPEGTK